MKIEYTFCDHNLPSKSHRTYVFEMLTLIVTGNRLCKKVNQCFKLERRLGENMIACRTNQKLAN